MDVVNFITESSVIETPCGIGLLEISISSRIVYRYLSLHKGVFDVFVSLVGVINMKYTLNSILGYDLVQNYLQAPDDDFGINKESNYPINFNKFLRDLVDGNLHTLESSKSDIAEIVTPTYLVITEEDKWIDYNEYKEAFANNTKILKEIYKLLRAEHELYKNP